ncbi:LacI family DNA-binding transcriptional regulator [Thalassococcus lentus]|uniref:LacI family DNA-binding transcriptional regulator n=1 Tax=Thalassococcus lentus TaxID=1210524 RepID=A0ABT4XQ59_9RHOB|nr:LacI family DNA-binding transcriptional regulator [Thalassococcus lentus]MDA7424088.1 LacI family DNA-binding transcriptional regulator [Thalassococcus lentus]
MRGRVTMRDVARQAGVSPMTVSRALKQDGSVNAATRAAVRDAAEQLGYVYDSTAQAFRAQRSGFLAVTLPSINNANFAATHRALTRSLANTELQLLLGVTNYRLDEEERLVRQLLARRPEAIVLTGGHHTEATRKLLQSMDGPVFEIWDQPHDPVDHVVGFSNADAMTMIVEHLAETGRKKFGYLGAIGDSDRRGAERRRGVLDAVKVLGLPDVTVLEACEAPISMTAGAQAVERFARDIRELDALICVSDPVAFGAISVLTRLGVSVPGDIAVTGFGAFEVAGLSNPTITTVDVGADRIGTELGRLVQSVLEADRDSTPINLQLTPTLIRGGSS